MWIDASPLYCDAGEFTPNSDWGPNPGTSRGGRARCGWEYIPTLYKNGERLPDSRQPKLPHGQKWVSFESLASAIRDARRVAKVRVVTPYQYAGNPDREKLANEGFTILGDAGEWIEVGPHAYIAQILERNHRIKVWINDGITPPYPGGPDPVPWSDRSDVE